jgi:hypothetical protein
MRGGEKDTSCATTPPGRLARRCNPPPPQGKGSSSHSDRRPPTAKRTLSTTMKRRDASSATMQSPSHLDTRLKRHRPLQFNPSSLSACIICSRLAIADRWIACKRGRALTRKEHMAREMRNVYPLKNRILLFFLFRINQKKSPSLAAMWSKRTSSSSRAAVSVFACMPNLGIHEGIRFQVG